MKCPVCDKNSRSMLCPNCGFDSSKNYGKHPTFGSVGKASSVSALRQEWRKDQGSSEPVQVPAAPPQMSESAPKRIRKTKWFTIAACLMMLVLGICIGVGLGGRASGDRPVESNAAKETLSAAKPDADEIFPSADPDTVQTHPAAESHFDDVTIKVAAHETAYGFQVWADVVTAFEAETGIKVELTTAKNLEDVISGPMQNGEYPDVVHLATGRPDGLTEQLVKANALHPLTNMLSTTIPGETATPADKIAGGFTDNNIVAPYGDGVTYMAPVFYSPYGLFYNAKLFEEKGWTVPTTWDEMWALGETAKAEGIALFTYPTVGYFDPFMFALMNAVGGPEFFNAVTTYQEGAWDSENGQTLLNILDKLAKYTHPSTPAQANNQDFTKNQQMVMDGRALFMPNGTWITGEMAEYAATLGDTFAWGMTAVPSAGEAPYAYCWFEQAWIPAGAEHKDAAELFVAYLYSDKAAGIFASAGAMQPILGLSDMLEDENAMFYSIYDNGARPAMGCFAAFAEIPGVTVSGTFYAPIDSLVAGTMTIDEYAELVKTNSAKMRQNLLN